MQDIPTVLARRRRQDVLFNILGIVCTLVGVATLVILLIDLAMREALPPRLAVHDVLSVPLAAEPGYYRRGGHCW